MPSLQTPWAAVLAPTFCQCAPIGSCSPPVQRLMGSQQSQQEEFIPLPQQHIVTVTDGVVDVERGAVASNASNAANASLRVGTTREAKAVRQPLALSSHSLRLQRDGQRGTVSLSAQFQASVDGFVEIFAPAREIPRAVDTPSADGSTTWPFVVAEGGGVHLTQRFVEGNASQCRFEFFSEALPAGSRMQDDADGATRWPMVMIFWPRAVAGKVDKLMSDPPDGALLVACALQGEQVDVRKQVVSWGGECAAFTIMELYGIRETQQQDGAARLAAGAGDAAIAADAEGQAFCVVCLTEPKDTALLPCGHLCVCYDCGASLRLNPLRNRCPLCRQAVHDLTHFTGIDHKGRLPVEPQAPLDAAPTAVRADLALQSPPAPQSQPQPGPESDQQAAAGAPNAHEAALSREDMRAARLRALAGQNGDANASAAEAARGPQAALPQKTLQRLGRELKQLEQHKAAKLEEHGIEVALADPAGEDLRVWTMRILTAGLDEDCALRKALSSKNVDTVEFEIWIPDAFPVAPPRVRVLRPYFSPGSFFVHQFGSLCLEVLTSQGWTPAMSLMQLGVQVKAMMSQGQGSVSSGACGEPGAAGRNRAWQIAERIEDVHKNWQHFSTS